MIRPKIPSVYLSETQWEQVSLYGEELMVLCLLALAAFAPPLPEAVPQVDVEQRVREFVQRARRGLGGEVAPLPENFTLRKPDPASNRIEFSGWQGDEFVGGGISLDSAGRIWGYSDNFESDPHWNDLIALDLSTLKELSKDFYLSAGFSGELILSNITSHHSPESSFLLQFQPAYQGVPFTPQHEVAMWIDHRTGKLEKYHRRRPCEPPSNLTPAVDLETARTKMMNHLFQIRPHVRHTYERHPVQLVIWRPEGGGPYDFLTPQQRAMAKNNQGMLAYWTWLHNMDTYDRYGNVGAAYEILLDAQTGRTLAIQAMEGGRGGGQAPTAKPFAWDLGVGPFLVARGDDWVRVEGADVASHRGPSPKGPAIPVSLHRGRWTVRAQFDPEAGTLAVAQDDRRIVGRPNEPLLRALRELAAR
jgi:hypothetical protein